MAKQLDPRIYTDVVHLQSMKAHVKKLSFLPKQRSKSVLNGKHQSRIRGRGLSFEELRDYRIGDDIRTIDWRVTAKTGKPHVRVYAQEKDKPALLVVDQRMSMFFGSQLNMKSVTACEAAAISAFRIFEQGDRVGAVIFNDSKIQSYKPSKKPNALAYLIESLSGFNQALHSDLIVPNDEMHFNQPLEAATRLVSHDALVIIFSDFAQVDETTEVHLRQLAAHNDVILCLVTDPLVSDLPDTLQLWVNDGKQHLSLDTSKPDVHRALESSFQKRVKQIHDWQTRFGVSVVPLSSAQDTLMQFYHAFGVPYGK